MLPKTSVIGAPSMRMRVGSLIDRIASTATPSRASTICSARRQRSAEPGNQANRGGRDVRSALER
jgi:hypothetical protein